MLFLAADDAEIQDSKSSDSTVRLVLKVIDLCSHYIAEQKLTSVLKAGLLKTEIRRWYIPIRRLKKKRTNNDPSA